MKIFLCGQKHFARGVLKRITTLPGVVITGVAAPAGRDSFRDEAERMGVPVMDAEKRSAFTLPRGVDLIVCAHSHQFIGEATRLRARYGGIGFHPSLLPLYRGRSAIEWVIKLGDRVTGGTVYQLSNTVDGGSILGQRHVLVSCKDSVTTLWRDKLQPLGVTLLAEAVVEIRRAGFIYGDAQDESLATWFPSMVRMPLVRPDLKLLESH